MNSWNQPQNSPYWNMTQYPQTNTTGIYGRAPVYHADPIHGENAAWAFPIGGGDIWLPDADKDIIWWIKIDQNGNKQVLPFDVKPHEEPKQTSVDEILARLSALEERVNGKQNKSNAKRSASISANATSTPTTTIESVD